MNPHYQALYIHIPFCKQRCAYCDFQTKAIAQDSPELDRYTEQLIKDIRQSSREGLLGNIKTIYIGGGTPSYLGQKQLVNLAYTLSLSINLTSNTEFTIEANPESLTEPMVRDLYALGVNRLSLGAQSLVDKELTALGRIHTAQQVVEAVRVAQTRFANISIDLMCGIPLQTLASWQQTLAEAAKLDVQHISVYPLTVEDATPLSAAIENGDLEIPSEDVQAQMMELATSILANAGYQRYEVASYAKPGFECQHNIAYWTGIPYLGLGRGAAGMRNLPDGSRERTFDNKVTETLTPTQATAEDLMLAMRMAKGVSKQQVKLATELLPKVKDTFIELQELGLIQLLPTANQQHYQPTQKGWLLGNELYSRIWDLSYS